MSAFVIAAAAGRYCRMYDGQCGQGSCTASGGRKCYDCGATKICCVNPHTSADNCALDTCGHGVCVAGAGQHCDSCANKPMCAVCDSAMTEDDIADLWNNATGTIGNSKAEGPPV